MEFLLGIILFLGAASNASAAPPLFQPGEIIALQFTNYVSGKVPLSSWSRVLKVGTGKRGETLYWMEDGLVFVAHATGTFSELGYRPRWSRDVSWRHYQVDPQNLGEIEVYYDLEGGFSYRGNGKILNAPGVREMNTFRVGEVVKDSGHAWIYSDPRHPGNTHYALHTFSPDRVIGFTSDGLPVLGFTAYRAGETNFAHITEFGFLRKYRLQALCLKVLEAVGLK